MTEIAASFEAILEARETMKRFAEQGGSCFVDGCSELSDNDVIIIAENMKEIMAKAQKEGK